MYDLSSNKVYKSDTDSEFDENNVEYFEDDDLHDNIVTQRKSKVPPQNGIFNYITSTTKKVFNVVSERANKLFGSKKQRKSRHHVGNKPTQAKRTYKFLRKVGFTKIKRKRIPRWASDLEFLKKLSKHMKENYDPTLIFGVYHPSSHEELKIIDLFDYKPSDSRKESSSKYFRNQPGTDYYDHVDIRGSSAQWNDDNSTNRKLGIPRGYAANPTPESTVGKSGKRCPVKKQLDFCSSQKMNKYQVLDMN